MIRRGFQLELTNTQEQDLAKGQPVEVVIGGKPCVLNSRSAFDQIKDGIDDSPWTEEEMDLLADEAIVSLPSEGSNGNGRSQLPAAKPKDADLLVGLSDAELQALAAGKLAPPVQERLSELLDRNTAGQLAADEETELDDLLERIGVLKTLKARALVTLKQHAGAFEE